MSLIITKAQIKIFAQNLIGSGRVVAVIKKENKFAFGELKNADDMVLDYDVALASPRFFLQPPHEKLIEFALGAKPKIEPSFDSEPFVIFGVHTYDLKAINQMDRIWADGNRDEHYLSRRQNATIVAIEPTRASKWSFWSSMEAQIVDTGFDILLTDIGDKYVVETGTKKGELLLTKYAPALPAAQEKESRARDEARNNLTKLCREERKIGVKSTDIPSLVAKNFEHPVWEKQASKCYSCGSCNLVCPTCFCFDVKDTLELDLKNGRRERYWDGCLLEDFARVASGENFREDRTERFRHRILRKMVYVPEKIGELACIGCGRCSEACLPDITDPVKIINAIKEGF